MKTTAELIKEAIFPKTVMVTVHEKAPWEKTVSESADVWRILGQRMIVFKDGSCLLIDEFAYDKAISSIKAFFEKKKAEELKDSKQSRFIFISACYVQYGSPNCTPSLLENAVYHFTDRSDFEKFILGYFNC